MLVNKRGRYRGFGLSEILVAIALFVTAITSLLAILTSSAHAVKQSQESVAAQNLAERLLEESRARPFDNIASYTGSHNAAASAQGNLAVISYTYGVTVTPLPNTTNPTMKNIAVRVDWVGDNIPRNVLLETAVYK